jgi:hypothetical protein
VIAAALGGSVTAGVGLSNYTIKNGESEYHFARITFEWLSKRFPHAENRFHNAGMRATGADVFAFCSHLLLPKGTNWVTTDFAINGVDRMDDLLSRLVGEYDDISILGLDVSHPDVVDGVRRCNGVPDQFRSINDEFDVPTLSLCALPIEAREELMAKDVHHWSDLGHHVAATMVIEHLERHERALKASDVNLASMARSTAQHTALSAWRSHRGNAPRGGICMTEWVDSAFMDDGTVRQNLEALSDGNWSHECLIDGVDGVEKCGWKTLGKGEDMVGSMLRLPFTAEEPCHLVVGYLSSYWYSMGVAAVRVDDAEIVRIDGNEMENSIQRTHLIGQVGAGEHVVEVQVIPETATEGHAFMVTGMYCMSGGGES